MRPQDLLARLENEAVFQHWKKKHPQAYASHLFSTLSPDVQLQGSWEVGWYNPEHEKVTVFVLEDPLLQKPEEDIFHIPGQPVPPLKISTSSGAIEEVLEALRRHLQEQYPLAKINTGFLVLQEHDGQTAWNANWGTNKLAFIHLLLHPVSKKLLGHQEIQVAEQG